MSSRELSRHNFSRPIDADKTVICSPHSLIAIVTSSHDVVIYRLNGQVAFTIKNPQHDDDDVEEEKRVKVARAEWSPNGRHLAIAWSDGTWRIHEAEKGDPIFESTVRAEDDELDSTVVLGLSWQQHSAKIQPRGDGLAGVPQDFPREVSLLDVVAVLPRLSALPAHGLRMSVEGAKFANQSSMDSIFAPIASHEQNGTVEVLLVHTSDNKIQVMLNGTSHVGTAKVPPAAAMHHASYASNTDCASHALLSAEEQSHLRLELLDLPLEELNGAVLHLTSHCTTRLSSLVQYVRRTTQCIGHDYTTGIALPNRLINNINMTLEEAQSSNATLSSALLHLAMTGQFQPDVLEWLTDIVKDTGLKRWDTSISTMYSAIQTHLHSHILPATERMTVAASRLRGLSRLHQGNAVFTPDEKLFSAILEKTNALRLGALRGLHICMNEWASWRVFSKWLKMQIEVASAGPNTKEAAEAEEREGLGIDFTVVIQHIQTVLQNGSELQSFVKGTAKDIDLTSLIAPIDAAIGAALDSVTSWQGRLFTTTRSLMLDHAAGEHMTDMLLQPQADAFSMVTTTISEDKTISLNTYPISAGQEGRKIRSEQVRGRVMNAKLYRSGQKLLCLEQVSLSDGHSPDGLQLSTFDISTQECHVLHQFDDKTEPEHMFVGGHVGKEFCVIIEQGSRSWSVHDLHISAAAK